MTLVYHCCAKPSRRFLKNNAYNYITFIPILKLVTGCYP